MIYFMLAKFNFGVWLLWLKVQTIYVPLLALGAEAAAGVITDKWGPLINLGAIGCVLAWFLLKTEPRLRRIEEAIDRQTRAIMIAVLSMDSVPDPVKTQANAVVAELDAANVRRNQAKDI